MLHLASSEHSYHLFKNSALCLHRPDLGNRIDSHLFLELFTNLLQMMSKPMHSINLYGPSYVIARSPWMGNRHGINEYQYISPNNIRSGKDNMLDYSFSYWVEVWNLPYTGFYRVPLSGKEMQCHRGYMPQ